MENKDCEEIFNVDFFLENILIKLKQNTYQNLKNEIEKYINDISNYNITNGENEIINENTDLAKLENHELLITLKENKSTINDVELNYTNNYNSALLYSNSDFEELNIPNEEFVNKKSKKEYKKKYLKKEDKNNIEKKKIKVDKMTKKINELRNEINKNLDKNNDLKVKNAKMQNNLKDLDKQIEKEKKELKNIETKIELKQKEMNKIKEKYEQINKNYNNYIKQEKKLLKNNKEYLKKKNDNQINQNENVKQIQIEEIEFNTLNEKKKEINLLNIKILENNQIINFQEELKNGLYEDLNLKNNLEDIKAQYFQKFKIIFE